MFQVNCKFLINVSAFIVFSYSYQSKMSFCTVSGGKTQDMKPLSTRRLNRIEKKKKKMAALLEISKLNECDRANKFVQMKLKELKTEDNFATTEPSPKRLKTEEEEIDALNNISIELGPSGKPKITGEDYIQLKKQLRETTQKMRLQPTFRLRELGEAASITVDLENRIPIFLADIQHLIMYSQLGPYAPYTPARWCQLEKYTKLISTNVFIVENLSAYHFISNESYFPFLSSSYPHKLEVVNSNVYKADLVQDLLMVPLTSTQMKKFISQYGSLENAVTHSNKLFDVVKNLFPIDDSSSVNNINHDLPNGDKFPRTQLLLSGWQLVEENFPLPIKGLMERKYAGYVLTKDKYEDVTHFSPMFALDCEMCITVGGGSELTRVSIVDEDGKLFYEQLVKPDTKIIDYLTKYSGITAKMMKKVKKKLGEVQDDIRNLLPANAILVGQSLSNDLHALKMMHPYIIDTSVIYNITGERTRKTKLQTLSREFLSERIQESTSGHCSIEDSLASLKLAKLKLKRSLCFGDAVLSGFEEQLKKHPQLGTSNYATNLFVQTTKIDKNASVVSNEDVNVKYDFYTYKKDETRNNKIKYHSVKTNEEVVEKLCTISKQHSLNIGHVNIDDNQLKTNGVNVFKKIDDWSKQIFEYTPTPGLNLIIFSGSKEDANGLCFIKLKRL